MIADDLRRLVATRQDNESIGEALLDLDEPEIEALVTKLSPADAQRLEQDWRIWGRPDQQPPDYCDDPECGCGGGWKYWVLCAGRAFGKTRTGSEWCHIVAEEYPGCRMGMIAPTAGDARATMIEGVSGILATQKPWNPCKYEPTNKRVQWGNGSQALVFSADEPERLRGPQYHFIWADELAAWKRAKDVWDQIRLGLRLRTRPGWPKSFKPRGCITTTPKPTEVIRRLVGAHPFKRDKTVHVTRGSTYANRANLAEEYFADIVADMKGTRLGRQELEGEVLIDVVGALFKSNMIDPYRIEDEQLPKVRAVAVAVDPAAGGDNETGIIVCAQGGPPVAAPDQEAVDDRRHHGYVLADLSLHASPDEWARRAVEAYYEFEADCIVAETNNGGDMVVHTIRTVDSSVPVKTVHATKRKEIRAEPIVALFEQGRVHMLGHLLKLEEQLLTWDPELSKSPDRLDAMVWGLTHLMVRRKIHKISAPQIVGMRANQWALLR